MQKMELSHTGVEVAEMGLGMALAFRLMDQFVAAGGELIDTANMYAHWLTGGPDEGGGESEACLGRWLKVSGKREKIFISTKVGQAYPGVPAGLKANTIISECEKSLKRLGTEMIDLYFSHADDRETPQEETMEAYHQLVKAGKVRFIGASNLRAWRIAAADQIAKARGWTAYCCIQQKYTYLQPGEGLDEDFLFTANTDIFDYARSAGLTVLAYSPLLGGAYTREEKHMAARYHTPRNAQRFQRLHEVQAQTGKTLNQIVYRWLLQQQPAILPLTSPSTEAQMTENLGALDFVLSAEQMGLLNWVEPE
jgi:aryl-alcohol dehydrogenase-like predicted oxidoreductase